jgi:hypothetical protein
MFLDIDKLVSVNKDVLIALDKSYILDKPITIPSSYTNTITIIGNGHSIENKTGFSFIVEGGSFRFYGGSINSPVLITGSDKNTPHAFVGVDFSVIQKDFPAITVNNIRQDPPMYVLVMASVAQEGLAEDPFISFNDQSEGTVWVVGCDLGRDSKKVIGGAGDRSSAVAVGNTLGSCTEILSPEIRDKISFNNYYYKDNERCAFPVENEYKEGILHNEPWVKDRRPGLDVSAIPTLGIPLPIDAKNSLEIVTGPVRYVYGRDLSSNVTPFEGHTTIWDQCSVQTHKDLSCGSIMINSYLDTYYNCSDSSILFTNPFDSAARETRITFVNRKLGTW